MLTNVRDGGENINSASRCLTTRERNGSAQRWTSFGVLDHETVIEGSVYGDKLIKFIGHFSVNLMKNRSLMFEDVD